MSHHLVAAEDACFAYPGGEPVLRQVSFRIHHGESVALIGANGAGKSTLLRLLCGSLSPTSGIVRIGDFQSEAGTLRHIRRTVGMVFQEPDDQLFMPTVRDDVAFGPINQGLSGAALYARVNDALAAVDAMHLAGRPPHRLSGGEKRIAAIATVLAMDPAILVMDEPTSNLDPRARRQVIALLRRFTHTKVIASHDLDMALDVCDRAIVLHQGAVAADGPALGILRDVSLLDNAHLEMPLRMQACPVCGGESM